MSVKFDSMKQIRIKPKVHAKLLDLQKSMWLKIPIGELANSAIDVGLDVLRQKLELKPKQ